MWYFFVVVHVELSINVLERPVVRAQVQLVLDGPSLPQWPPPFLQRVLATILTKRKEAKLVV
jgi:hypothetical protein